MDLVAADLDTSIQIAHHLFLNNVVQMV